MFNWLFRNVLGNLVAKTVRRHLNAFEAATQNPREVQDALLARILDKHRHTTFARDHHFTSIHSAADFRQTLPISGYDYFEPYLEQVRQGKIDALLGDKKVLMFALTSGTTATRKTIPVTPQYLADYRRGWNIWGLQSFRNHPEVKLRPIVQFSGDWDEYRTEAGIPCGSVTGLTATMQKRVIRWLYCVPACVGKIKDPLAKYYLILRLSIPRKVGMIIAANPSTLVNMARVGDQEKEELIRDIFNGTLSSRFNISAEIRSALRGRLKQRPQRAMELERIIHETGHLYPKDYWQHPCMIGNWTGGSVGTYMRHYPQFYGDMFVRDVGLIASEGRMTIPMENNSSSGVLDITSHYFEFMPEAEAHSSNPITLAAHEVEEGKNYFILPTTAFGLYRYHISDLVRITGFHNKTPLVAFLSKGSLFSNITGEKLSEYQVTEAVGQALQELNLSLSAYSVAICWDEEMPYYGLFVERKDLMNRDAGMALGECIERHLRRLNIEYAAKRDSMRLGNLRLQIVAPGGWADWDRKRLQKTGGTAEQYKRPCLIADQEFRNSISIEEEVTSLSLKS